MDVGEGILNFLLFSDLVLLISFNCFEYNFCDTRQRTEEAAFIDYFCTLSRGNFCNLVDAYTRDAAKWTVCVKLVDVCHVHSCLRILQAVLQNSIQYILLLVISADSLDVMHLLYEKHFVRGVVQTCNSIIGFMQKRKHVNKTRSYFNAMRNSLQSFKYEFCYFCAI